MRRPHLVLTDLGRHDGVLRQKPGHLVYDLLWLDRIGLEVVVAGALLAELEYAVLPRGPLLALLQPRYKRVHDGPGVAHEADPALDVLAYLGRVDVDMHDFRLGAELAQLPRNPVAEPRADREQHVAVVEGVVCDLSAVHPAHSQHEGVVFGHRPLGHQCGDDGRRQYLRELSDLGSGPGPCDAPTHQYRGPLGLFQELDGV